MSTTHLEKLRTALEKSHWIVRRELPGDGLKISGYWEVCRPNGEHSFKLAFEGLDDLGALPIEKAYGCFVVGDEELGMYFGKVGKSFGSELETFINKLE